MRFFIALEIPENSKQDLLKVQQRLTQIIPGIRLTDNGKLHLTIAFVGEQPDILKDDLIEVLKTAVSGIHPFQVAPAYIDGFPNLHHAKVFWVGVKGDIDKLFILRERIKDELEKLGLSTDERRYVPHIALAKINQDFKLTASQETEIEKLETNKFNPISITSIKLFTSIPSGSFHQHNTLAEIKLIF